MNIKCLMGWHEIETITKVTNLVRDRMQIKGLLVYMKCSKCHYEEAYITDGTSHEPVDLNYAKMVMKIK